MSTLLNKNIMYTYIIKSHDLYKIGKSGDVEKRIGSIRTGNPWIEHIRTIKGDYEGYLHSKFTEKRVQGEWFRLVESDLQSIDGLLKEAKQINRAAEGVIKEVINAEDVDDKGRLNIRNVGFTMTQDELKRLMDVIEYKIREQSCIIDE